MPSVNVVVCADKNIEIGLHATLHSLLDFSSTKIKIYFINKGYSSKDIDTLKITLAPFDGSYELFPLTFDDKCFNGLRGLYGNNFTFTKIMISELIKEEKIVYLDSDIIVKLDISELYNEQLNDYCIGVSGIGNIKWSLEHNFFVTLGLDQYAPYFNCGVILLDLERWRKDNISSKCMTFANKYPNNLLTADQTVLNYVFYKNFKQLNKKYNVPLYPNTKPISTSKSNRIFHFVGSPKPWDFLGEIVHRNYHIFKNILDKTYFRNFKSYKNVSIQTLKRTLRLSRAYYLNFLRR